MGCLRALMVLLSLTILGRKRWFDPSLKERRRPDERGRLVDDEEEKEEEEAFARRAFELAALACCRASADSCFTVGLMDPAFALGGAMPGGM